MARLRRLRPGPLGIALALWDVWRRLPPKQRRQVANVVREHGPKLAAKGAKAYAKRKRR